MGGGGGGREGGLDWFALCERQSGRKLWKVKLFVPLGAGGALVHLCKIKYVKTSFRVQLTSVNKQVMDTVGIR